MSLPPNCIADRNRWCDFERISESESHVREFCTKCRRVVTYPVRNGQMDNEAYRKDHIADFCQPYGPTRPVYIATYGKKHYEARMKTGEELKEKRKKKDWHQLAEETYKETMDEERRKKRNSVTL